MFEDLIPEFQDFARALVDAAAAAGLQPRVTSTRRSHSAQRRLYDRYLAGASPFPALPPGQSAHEYGFAFDLVTSPFEALADVGYTWQQWGGLWGGPRDPVHIEYPGFVPPPATAGANGAIGGAVRAAAQKIADLPWYLQVFLPAAATVESTEPFEQAGAKARADLCRYFGIFCSS